jgi:asparagine synthetase B (glutamine-hydrolysing)
MLFGNFETLSRRIGIEVRYPFLDPDLVRAVAGLSIESRYRTKSGRFSLRLRELQPGFKYAMLQVAADRVPAEILNRPRKSFTAPFGGWLTENAFVDRIIRPFQRSRFHDTGIVKPAFVREVLQRVGMFPSPALFQLWALVTLAAWYDRYVDG